MTSSLRLPAPGPHEQQIYYNTYTPVPSVFSWPRVGDAPVSGERKRPIAARTRRAAAALSTVQPVASEATPALSLRFTRERRPEPVPMCVSCGGGREGPPRSALRRSPELHHPCELKLAAHFCKKIDNFRPGPPRRPLMKSTPNSVGTESQERKATLDGASSAIRRPPRSLSARRRRRNFRSGSAVCTARRPSAGICSRTPASTARRPPRWRAAPGERGERTGRPVAG